MPRKSSFKPFDGAISEFYEKHAPADVQQAVAAGKKGEILNPKYPYAKRMRRKRYQRTLSELQIELGKMQNWIKSSGARIVVAIEGRDAAGKGGTIKRFREFMNPRGARVVALGKPSDSERTQWYFQRYIAHLPSAGEIVFFDRSWYNRGVVEHVFNFCEPHERENFFQQVNEFEKLLVTDGIILVKIWLYIGRAVQLKRFMDRECDRLKQWKLSPVDVAGLAKWDAFTDAIQETFDRSDNQYAPWHIIRGDDKRRARIAAIQTVLNRVDYTGKNHETAVAPDHLISGGIQMFNA